MDFRQYSPYSCHGAHAPSALHRYITRAPTRPPLPASRYHLDDRVDERVDGRIDGENEGDEPGVDVGCDLDARSLHHDPQGR